MPGGAATVREQYAARLLTRAVRNDSDFGGGTFAPAMIQNQLHDLCNSHPVHGLRLLTCGANHTHAPKVQKSAVGTLKNAFGSRITNFLRNVAIDFCTILRRLLFICLFISFRNSMWIQELDFWNSDDF
jgi:hypothetical protein